METLTSLRDLTSGATPFHESEQLLHLHGGRINVLVLHRGANTLEELKDLSLQRLYVRQLPALGIPEDLQDRPQHHCI